MKGKFILKGLWAILEPISFNIYNEKKKQDIEEAKERKKAMNDARKAGIQFVGDEIDPVTGKVTNKYMDSGE